MKRLFAALLVTVMGIFSVCQTGPASADDKVTLRVACYGGAFTATQLKYAGSIFTLRTGIDIQWIDGNPTDHLAKMLASRGRAAPFDVVYLDEYVQESAIAAKTVMKLDPSIVTNLKYLYDKAKNPDGYGPAINFWSVGLAYNTDLFEKNGISAPTSWADLWNPKLAGKIALPDITQSSAKDLIIATARLNGGDEKNADMAFKKLAEIQPLYYYRSSADLESKMTSGDAWITVWNNARPANLIDKGVPLKFIYPKEGGFGHESTIDVVAGTPHPKEAMMFVNQVLDPLAQLGQANEVPYGPVNKLIAPILAEYPKLASRFPSSPEDLAKLYIANPKDVNAQYAKWVDEWNHTVIH
jgi:putative spermidine/putrescine transport system substrate-binding protein